MTQVADEQSGDEGYQFVWPPPDAEWPGFCRYWQPIILLRCKNLHLGREDAEDVAQEILIALAKKDKQSTLRFPNINALGGYISTAVSNWCQKLHTRARRQQPIVAGGSIPDHRRRDRFVAEFRGLVPPEVSDEQVLGWLLERVSDKNRDLFRLRYDQERQWNEISATLGVPVTTLFDRHQAELSILRRRLDRDAN